MSVSPAQTTPLETIPGILVHDSGVVILERHHTPDKKERQAARDRLRYLAKKGELHRLFNSAYATSEAWSHPKQRPEIVAIAASLAFPKRALSGRAAALLHDLPLIAPLTDIELIAPNAKSTRTITVNPSLRISLIHARPGTPIVQRSDGIRLTSLAHTAVATAKKCPVDLLLPSQARLPSTSEFEQLAEAMATLDAALRGDIAELTEPHIFPPRADVFRREPTSPLDLLRALNHDGSNRGLRHAEMLALLASPLSESPLESAVKILLTLINVRFQQQVRLVGGNGRFLARVDFYLPDYGAVIEADGLAKYNLENVRHDRHRDMQLMHAGYKVLHLTWKEVFSLEAVRIVQKFLQHCDEFVAHINQAQANQVHADHAQGAHTHADHAYPGGYQFPQHHRMPRWLFAGK